MFTIVKYPTKEIVATLPGYQTATSYLVKLSDDLKAKGEAVELTETFLTIKGETEIVYSIEAE
jgi:hypothetical protein